MTTSMDPASSTSPRFRWALKVAPFVPIVVALGVALGVHFWQRAAVPTASTSTATAGSLVPDFVLYDGQEKEDAPPVRLSTLTEKGPVLIIFFPQFSCPKCRGYLSEVSELLPEFKDAGLQIVSVCRESAAHIRGDLEIYDRYPFPVLGDFQEDHWGDVSADFGVGNGAIYGVYIVDRQRRVQFADKADSPYGDLDALLEIGRNLKKAK
jgi:peroxiredoxin